METLAIKGSPAQQTQALKIASTLTPACSASTPTAAVSSAIQSAATTLTQLAAPYQSSGSIVP